MKPKTLILTIVAVTCGLGASYMTSRLLAERSDPSQEKVEVLVAKKGLDQGMVIKDIEEVFKVKLVAADQVDKDFCLPKDSGNLKGRQLKRALRPDDTIRQDDFATENEWSLKNLMTQGYRAIGIRVNAESSAAGWSIVPHSRVDIISTVRRGNDKDSYSQILLENVLVLAADSNVTHDGSGKPVAANVVTVALKPEDCQKVALAREMGPLSLVLRKYNDNSRSSSTIFTGEKLLQNSGEREVVENTDPPVPTKDPTKPVEVAKVDPKSQKPDPKPDPKSEQNPDNKKETKPKTEIVSAPTPELPGRPHRIMIQQGDNQSFTDYRIDENGAPIVAGEASEPAPPRPKKNR